MKSKLILSAFVIWVLGTSAYFMVPVQNWKISKGYSIKFTSKDPTGIFKDFKGNISFDENDLANSKFDVNMDISSISTGNGMQNKKAQTEEWFDAGKYPQIQYVSTKIEKVDKGYAVYGNLSMKGISKPYKVNLTVKKDGSNLKFIGTFNVNRMDFKVGKKSDAVPDVMKIDFSIPVSK